MMRIIDLEIGEEVQVETGYTNWNRADNEFYCTVSGISEDGIGYPGKYDVFKAYDKTAAHDCLCPECKAKVIGEYREKR